MSNDKIERVWSAEEIRDEMANGAAHVKWELTAYLARCTRLMSAFKQKANNGPPYDYVEAKGFYWALLDAMNEGEPK